MMEAAYQEGIGLIDTLPLDGGFDVAGFKKDVEEIFSQDKMIIPNAWMNNIFLAEVRK